MRRSTILESKPELLEKVMKKSHRNDKVYYVNHYSLSVVKMETLRQIFTIYDTVRVRFTFEHSHILAE